MTRADRLCNQAHELVGREGEDAEHTVAHDLRGASDAYMASAELIFEAAVDTLARGAFVVANLLGELEAQALTTPGFSFEFPLEGRVAARVGVDERDMAQ